MTGHGAMEERDAVSRLPSQRPRVDDSLVDRPVYHRNYRRGRKYVVMPTNPVMRPPIVHARATKFKNKVGPSTLATIRKGNTTPMINRVKPIAINLDGCSISSLYL